MKLHGAALSIILCMLGLQSCTHQNLTASNRSESDLLIPFRKGDSWGYCDRQKRIRIAVQYEEARPFIDDRAVVKQQGKYGHIDGTEGPSPKLSMMKHSTMTAV